MTATRLPRVLSKLRTMTTARIEAETWLTISWSPKLTSITVTRKETALELHLTPLPHPRPQIETEHISDPWHWPSRQDLRIWDLYKPHPHFPPDRPLWWNREAHILWRLPYWPWAPSACGRSQLTITSGDQSPFHLAPRAGSTQLSKREFRSLRVSSSCALGWLPLLSVGRCSKSFPHLVESPATYQSRHPLSFLSLLPFLSI